MPRLISFRASSTRLLWWMLLLAGVLCWSSPSTYAIGCAQPSFGPATTFNIPQTVYGIAVADYNRDGKPDVATANRNNSTISIILGNGAGGFGAPTSLTVGGGPTGIATTDFNRDGKADLVTANNSGSSLSILLGDGQGGFGTPTSVPLGFTPWSVNVADFNNDDLQDIIVNGFGGGGRILLGTDTGGFNFAPFFSSGAINPTAADFNEDGRLDLPGASGTSVVLMWGVGNGSFIEGPSFNVGFAPSHFIKGDFNGDGRLDIAASNSSGTGKVAVLLNHGQGGFSPAASYDLNTISGSSALFAADLTFDGRTDIASAINLPGFNNGAVSILSGDGKSDPKIGRAHV